MPTKNIPFKNYIKKHPSLYNATFVLRNIPREVRSFFLPLISNDPSRYAKGDSPLHGDTQWQEFVKLVVRDLPVSSVVETGTNRGDSTMFFGSVFPKKVFTAELMGMYYREAKHRLKVRPNIHALRGSSEEVMERLYKENAYGDLPLFFLDAHWYDYWPMAEELSVIKRLKKAIVMIDDFKVPGRPYFTWHRQDRDGVVIAENELTVIAKYLDPKRHAVLFPKYDAPQNLFAGYVIIFQDMADELAKLEKVPFIAENFERGN